MLRLVLEDLQKNRRSLFEALESAAERQPRRDYVDCWNLIDEIGEHDRRIAILKDIIARSLAERVKN